jgi:hypothetical protein
VQNILSPEHVIDDNDKSLTIAPKEGSQPLGLFCDAHSEKIMFQHYFMGIQDHHLHVFIKRLCK